MQAGQGGIISAALGLIKEKEKQADKASERISDGIKTQMELTSKQGSWTGDSAAPAPAAKEVVKEKVVEKEKVNEPEEASATPAKEKEDDDDISKMGIIGLAQSASK